MMALTPEQARDLLYARQLLFTRQAVLGRRRAQLLCQLAVACRSEADFPVTAQQQLSVSLPAMHFIMRLLQSAKPDCVCTIALHVSLK